MRAEAPWHGRTVLAVFAHPDDESLACGGTLARLSDGGARVVLLCASHGELGQAGRDTLGPGEDVARARARELRRAAAVLGFTDVILLNHRDGMLRWSEEHSLHVQIVNAIVQAKPDAVITFGADGLYWHPDHVGVHERTVGAVRSMGWAAPPLYCATLPPGAMRGIAGPENTFWGISPDAFGDEAAPPTLVVDVGPWVPRKLSAIRCHRTQFDPTHPLASIDDTAAAGWLGIEHFHRAPDSPGAALLEDLGTGCTPAP